MSSPARHPGHPVHPQFTDRWSPRAFTPEEIPVDTLLTLLEAGRWSPSASNVQPWRFAWGRRGTPAFAAILGGLVPFNQGWAQHAAALVAVASVSTMVPAGKTEPVPNRWHAFDAGAAWMAVALQAHALGWSTHGMGGIDAAALKAALGAPADHDIHMAFAIGRRGDPAQLPEGLLAREKPSDRLPLAAISAEGRFGG